MLVKLLKLIQFLPYHFFNKHSSRIKKIELNWYNSFIAYTSFLFKEYRANFKLNIVNY